MDDKNANSQGENSLLDIRRRYIEFVFEATGRDIEVTAQLLALSKGDLEGLMRQLSIA